MILTIKNKYSKTQIIKLINTLNLNFIILNNKLIFTHTINNFNFKLLYILVISLLYYQFSIVFKLYLPATKSNSWIIKC